MTSSLWSREIEGVSVTVDVDATRAAYASCNYGLGCECGDCKLVEPLLPSLLSVGLVAFLAEIGVDPFKPLEFVCSRESDRWFMAELWYECVGSMYPQVQETAGLVFEGAIVTFAWKRLARDQFTELSIITVNVEFELEWFTHIVEGVNRDE
jgi:hypothetical protein